jgi:hypothetical protein
MFRTHWVCRGLIYTSLARSSDQVYSELVGTQSMPSEIMFFYFLASLIIFEPLRETGECRSLIPKTDQWKFWALRLLRYFIIIGLLQGGVQCVSDSVSRSHRPRFSPMSLVLWTLWTATIGEYAYRLLMGRFSGIVSRIQQI